MRAGYPRTADGMSALLASAAKDPTVGSLHSIVWAGDSDSHVQVLVLWRKTNLVVTTLITQARLEHYFVTLVVCGHSDVEAQNGAAFVNRQRFVVSGLELTHDCPGIAHGSNRNAARRFDLYPCRNRILAQRTVGIHMITTRDVNNDSRLDRAAALCFIIRVVTIDADVGLRLWRSLEIRRDSNQYAQKRDDDSSMDCFCFHFRFD